MVCKSAAIATAALSRSVTVEVRTSKLEIYMTCDDFTDAVSDLLVIHHGRVAGLPYDEVLCVRFTNSSSTGIASVERGAYR
jgi:hypothetical protein